MIVLSFEPILKREYQGKFDSKARLFLKAKVMCWCCKYVREISHYGGQEVHESFLLDPTEGLERLVSILQGQHDSRGIKGQPRNQMCTSCGVVSMIPNEEDFRVALWVDVNTSALTRALGRVAAHREVVKGQTPGPEERSFDYPTWIVDTDVVTSLGITELRPHLGGVHDE